MGGKEEGKEGGMKGGRERGVEKLKGEERINNKGS